jgi:hypothetical protein
VSDLIRYYAFLDGIWDFRQYRYWYLLAGFPLLLFSYPIVLWVRHLRDDEKAEEGRATVWLLALFAFLIPAVAFAISQFSPLSVWYDRHLIIAAAPYMLLVAMAVNRLRPVLIKAITMVLIVGWATLAGVNYSLQRGDHIAWDVLARQMSQAEPLKTNGIKVYVLGEHPFGMFQAMPLKFYLGWAGERRFEVRVVKDMAVPPGNLFTVGNQRGIPVLEVKDITALDGEHYWVAFVDRGWKQEHLPQEILKDNGYLVGEVLRAGTSYKLEGSPRFVSLTLFPVWRH